MKNKFEELLGLLQKYVDKSVDVRNTIAKITANADISQSKKEQDTIKLKAELVTYVEGSDGTQKLEKFQLLLKAHGNNECLISVAKVHAAPDGGIFQHIPMHPIAIHSAGSEKLFFILAYVVHVLSSKHCITGVLEISKKNALATDPEGSHSQRRRSKMLRGTTHIRRNAVGALSKARKRTLHALTQPYGKPYLPLLWGFRLGSDKMQAGLLSDFHRHRLSVRAFAAFVFVIAFINF